MTNAETHEKFTILDPKLVPRIAVLDPELMVGLPPFVTATTGMDALTHAVEAYINQNGTAYTDENALLATRLIFENLEKAHDDGADLEARNNMALASFYAGISFTRAYVGYVHAIAHRLGGLYGVPHGLANAVVLPYVLEYSREEAEEKLANLAIAGGIVGYGTFALVKRPPSRQARIERGRCGRSQPQNQQAKGHPNRTCKHNGPPFEIW